jgi:hypothetical protein
MAPKDKKVPKRAEAPPASPPGSAAAEASPGKASPPSKRNHAVLLGSTSSSSLSAPASTMPTVNADVHKSVMKDIDIIMGHPLFSNIRSSDPLNIDESANKEDIGYKAS